MNQRGLSSSLTFSPATHTINNYPLGSFTVLFFGAGLESGSGTSSCCLKWEVENENDKRRISLGIHILYFFLKFSCRKMKFSFQ